MRDIKVLALPAILMLGLLISGLAYAHWEKILTITGSVATGNLHWEFTGCSAEDTALGEYDWNCRDNFVGPSPYFWHVNKDVGRTAITITDPRTITLTLTNVYPSYWTSVSVYVHCTGTTPLKIDSVVVNGVVIRKGSPKIRLDLTGDGKYDIEIWWKESWVFGYQLKYCEDSDEISFWVHVLQDAPKGQPLSFTIEMVAVNYNEYVPPEDP